MAFFKKKKQLGGFGGPVFCFFLKKKTLHILKIEEAVYCLIFGTLIEGIVCKSWNSFIFMYVPKVRCDAEFGRYINISYF